MHLDTCCAGVRVLRRVCVNEQMWVESYPQGMAGLYRVIIVGVGRSPSPLPFPHKGQEVGHGEYWPLAMGWEKTLPLCEIDRKWNPTQQASAPSHTAPPFPGQGCGWRDRGFPSRSARPSPANGCLGKPSGMTALPCSLAGIMSPVCLRPTPASGCKYPLSSAGHEALWGGRLCDLGDSGQGQETIGYTPPLKLSRRLAVWHLFSSDWCRPLGFLKLPCPI